MLKIKELVTRVVARGPRYVPLSAGADRLLSHFPMTLSPEATILDLGCTDPSLYSKLATQYKRVVGLVQIDQNDVKDLEVAEALRKELMGYKVECELMPTLYTLPPFQDEFDAAVSEDMLSYSPEYPESIIQGVYKALKPGGAFICELGADGNLETLRMACYDVLREHGIDASLHDPYFFPTEKEMKIMLESNGFRVKIDTITVRQPFPCSPLREDVALVDYMHTGIGQKFLRPLPDADAKRKLVAEVVRLCYNSMYRGLKWNYNSIRLQFVATKPK